MIIVLLAPYPASRLDDVMTGHRNFGPRLAGRPPRAPALG
jgi:hypothetical protein